MKFAADGMNECVVMAIANGHNKTRFHLTTLASTKDHGTFIQPNLMLELLRLECATHPHTHIHKEATQFRSRSRTRAWAPGIRTVIVSVIFHYGKRWGAIRPSWNFSYSISPNSKLYRDSFGWSCCMCSVVSLVLVHLSDVKCSCESKLIDVLYAALPSLPSLLHRTHSFIRLNIQYASSFAITIIRLLLLLL